MARSGESHFTPCLTPTHGAPGSLCLIRPRPVQNHAPNCRPRPSRPAKSCLATPLLAPPDYPALPRPATPPYDHAPNSTGHAHLAPSLPAESCLATPPNPSGHAPSRSTRLSRPAPPSLATLTPPHLATPNISTSDHAHTAPPLPAQSCFATPPPSPPRAPSPRPNRFATPTLPRPSGPRCLPTPRILAPPLSPRPRWRSRW